MSAPVVRDSAAQQVRRQAWAYLAAVAEPPCAPLIALATEVGPEEAARAVREVTLPGVLERLTQARRHRDTSAADLAHVAALGGRLLTRDDPEWPAERFAAFTSPDAAGRDDAVAPLALWVKGRGTLAELSRRAVSVVGTRASSGYGEHVTAEISHDLARAGWTVVSGAAHGIDGAAHRAALAADGATVAVLACGVDRAYPRGHEALLRRIAVDGLVVSEYAPGTYPARHRFLTRNRLVAALGGGVLVVEAGWRSGARNTAGWAADLNRPVMAVPGPVTALGSAGCHQMLRERQAELVTTAAEVLEHVGPMGQLAEQPELPAAPTDGLSPAAGRVYDALPARAPVEECVIAARSGLSAAQVRPALGVLELEGLVAWSESGWVRVRHGGRPG